MADAQNTGGAPDRSSAARDLARVRWSPSPVVARAVQTVITRAGELDDTQRAAIEAAIEEAPGHDRT
jgi:hypothetical protein